MEKNLETIIKEIHASEYFGIISEAGAGACIATKLYEIDGASKTIFFSEQPYNKIYQKRKYFPSVLEKVKSVSKYYTEEAIKEIKRSLTISEEDLINFILTTSFQVESEDSKRLTHGYISLYNAKEHSITTIHLSIPFRNTRKGSFLAIAITGIRFLYNETICPIDDKLGLDWVDNYEKIYLKSTQTDKQKDKITLINNLIKAKEEVFLVLDAKTDSFIRYEDFLRSSEGVVLQKGSFNPIHSSHVEIFNLAQKKYPNFQHAFFMSLERFDKPPVPAKEILARATAIQKMGYNVVICKDPLFKGNIYYHQSHWAEKEIIFSMGRDTVDRLINSIYVPTHGYVDLHYFKHLDSLKVQFLIFDRKGIKFNDLVLEILNAHPTLFVFETTYVDPGVSSTKIREALNKNQ